MDSALGVRGTLSHHLRRVQHAPAAWRLRNTFRWHYLWACFAVWLARAFSRVMGVVTITSELRAVLWHEGKPTDFGIISRRLITDAGVAFLVDDWDNNAMDLTNMNYHSCGTGAVAENVADVALGAESDPGITTRAAGVKSQPSAWILRTVGVNVFTGGGAITEHGLFSQLAVGGTLWDRHVFAAINVVATDSIQWQYNCTVNSGG